MLRSVFIREDFPREVSKFNSTFIEGMQGQRYFAYFFLIGSLCLFILAAFKFKMVFPSIVLLCVSAFSYYTIQSINARVAERKEIFINGEIIFATVKTHDRSFYMLRSSRDYTIDVDVGSSELLTIVNKRKGIWDDCPIGSKIIGITYKGKYYFGEEMGCHFKLFEKKK